MAFLFYLQGKSQQMHLRDLHDDQKTISAAPFFKEELGHVTALHLSGGSELKEHTSPVKAKLLLVTGDVSYIDEDELTIHLKPGEYVEIPPNKKHRVLANADSELLLVK